MKGFFRGFGIFLALISVGVVSAFAVIALLLRQEEVRVPDFTGQDIVSVIDALPQLGLQPKIERRESHPTLPRDTVISQSPAPGNSIKKGRQVQLVLSLGPSDTQVPKLTGEHFRKADIMIRQAGFFPGPVSRVSSNTIERDMVIGQDPPAGSPLEKGGSISLLISSGKRADLLVMPKLTGKKAEEAVRTLERIGLQFRTVFRTSDKPGAAERLVVQQKPAEGSPVAPDATVEIIVSK